MIDADMEESRTNLNLYMIRAKGQVHARGNLMKAYAFARDAQEAFGKVMDVIAKEHCAAVFKGQQFDVLQIALPDSFVFGIEACGGEAPSPVRMEPIKIDMNKIKSK